MHQIVRESLYGGDTREFVSAFGLEESVRRLDSATARSVMSAMTKEIAVGKVSVESVSLQRVIPMVGNSFKPYFAGKFVEDGDRVLLRGTFTMSRSSKVFMSIWFGFTALWTVLAFMALAAGTAPTWWFPFAGLAMLGAGVGMVKAGKWFSRNDTAWLSCVIEEALNGHRNGRAT